MKAEGMFRKGLERRVIDVNNGTPESHFAFDDEVRSVVNLPTVTDTVDSLQHPMQQSMGQLLYVARSMHRGDKADSLGHFQHFDSGLTYNGAKPTVENLSDTSQGTANTLPTLDRKHLC